jgi:signal transduction histidine kinase
MRKSILLGATFSALLLIIGASAVAVWSNATIAQDRIAALQNLHARAGAALVSIRSNVYLNGILVRDYLLDADPAHAQEYIDQFDIIRRKTDESFRILESLGQESAQREALERLRNQLEIHFDPTEVMLDWSPEEKRAQRNAMLRQRLRRRQEVFALAEQVEQLMSANYTRERERITGADREFRASLGWTTGVALLFGLAVAAASFSRMLQLERASQRAESELRRLSGQIRTAQEQERKRLSRELHDQVGQMLTGLRMELTNVARMHDNAESEIAARIARAKGLVEQTLGIVRNIAMLLRPSMLDDLGLTPALAWLAKEASKPSGIEIGSDIDPAVESLPESHRTCIFRIVQEALTNVLRHSGARKVEIVVKSRGGWLEGAIVDDGRGFDPGLGKGKGLGLIGMDERVKELGGSIQINSAPGKGSRIEFRLPQHHARDGKHDSHSDSGRSRNRSSRFETPA